MPEAVPGWHLVGFLDRLDDWAARECPPDDLRLVVTGWILTRFDSPYQGVHRQPGYPNLWYAVVPESHDGNRNVVVCGYWIEESTRTVRCDSFVTLAVPP